MIQKTFYLSISEGNLLNALGNAKCIVNIQPEAINIILHCKNSILYLDGDIWVKKASKEGFDVPQECYEDAEISELIGLSV